MSIFSLHKRHETARHETRDARQVPEPVEGPESRSPVSRVKWNNCSIILNTYL